MRKQNRAVPYFIDRFRFGRLIDAERFIGCVSHPEELDHHLIQFRFKRGGTSTYSTSAVHSYAVIGVQISTNTALLKKPECASFPAATVRKPVPQVYSLSSPHTVLSERATQIK